VSAATAARPRPSPAAPRPGGCLEHAEFEQRRYFPSLDGVRAVAILLVFTAHLADQGFWGKLYGGNGVTVFFVLSGFLITTLALREESRRGRMSLKSFYIRRLFRIYPTYVGVLLLYCLLIYGAHFQADRRAEFSAQLPYYWLGFPEHGFFALAGHAGAPFDGAWSIGIEEKFYLLWPVVGFVLLVGAFTRRMWVLGAAAALFALAPVITRNGHYLGPYLFIALGCIAALLAHDPRHYRRLRPLGGRWPLALSLLAFAGLQLAVGAEVLSGRGIDVLDGIVITFALVGIVVSTGRVNGFLSSRPMVFLGRISYVFYLTHNFAINAVERTPLGDDGAARVAGDAVVSLVFAILIAWALHVALEKPFIRVGHHLAHRDKPFHALS